MRNTNDKTTGEPRSLDGLVSRKVKELLDLAPTKAYRMFRAYALNAALRADDCGDEFKKLIESVTRIGTAND